MAPVVALAGFMGSGKSAVGSALAKNLGWRFCDLDREVQSAIGVGIREYFGSNSEQEFREIETRILGRSLERAGEDPTVLALGGGTLERSENRSRLRGVGSVVLLAVSPEEAWSRVAGSDRPLAQEEGAFGALYAKRRAAYEEAADWIVPTDGREVDEVAKDLAQLIETSGAGFGGLWGQRLGFTERSSLIVGGQNSLGFLEHKAAEERSTGRALHVFTDKNVLEAWGHRLLPLLGVQSATEAYVLEPGETSKRLSVLGGCWEWLAGRKARREDVVVALGGGVVGDLVGFTAATYHRGVALWQVPTTLVAQVDSSVGGKTAINLDLGKNLAGAFYQADLVVIDPATLSTLPEREYTGALGEVVKHALLSSETSVRALEEEAPSIAGRDENVLSELVKRNVRFKASFVEQDERELGPRAVLNLGHTIAHALETSLGYGTINHGQAVALGVLVALAVSEQVLGLDEAVLPRIRALLQSLGLETRMDLPEAERLLFSAGHDKKVRVGTSGFVGLRAIGHPVWGVDVPSDVLRAAMAVIER